MNKQPEHLYVRSDDVVNKGLWKLFPAINVDKTAYIPKDYPGPMGVPITFMDKFCDSQFELLGKLDNGCIKGRNLYKRLLIRNLKPDLPEYIDLMEWFAVLGIPLEIEMIEGQGYET